MKAMFSQPIAGKHPSEIRATREKVIETLQSLGYEVINTTVDDAYYQDKLSDPETVNPALCYLVKSLDNMTKCDAAFFCKGWEYSRGCKLEHDIAKAYGIKIIYEE